MKRTQQEHNLPKTENWDTKAVIEKLLNEKLTQRSRLEHIRELKNLMRLQISEDQIFQIIESNRVEAATVELCMIRLIGTMN